MSDYIEAFLTTFTILAVIGMICGTIYGCDRTDKAHQEKMLEKGYVWRTSATPESGFMPIKEAQSND